jgi:hypothetical protein
LFVDASGKSNWYLESVDVLQGVMNSEMDNARLKDEFKIILLLMHVIFYFKENQKEKLIMIFKYLHS